MGLLVGEDRGAVVGLVTLLAANTADTLRGSYFRRQCYISADPDETTLAAIISLVGEDRFFWASDFPHPDHAPDYIPHLKELVAGLSNSARDGILGQNVSKAYDL